jgi:hypothetical protein
LEIARWLSMFCPQCADAIDPHSTQRGKSSPLQESALQP